MPSAETVTTRLARLFARGEDGLLVLTLAIMIGLAAVQIGMRNLDLGGVSWGDPLLRVLVLWTGMLGALVATRERNHITVDVLSRFLSPEQRRWTHVATDLFAAAVCSTIAWHAARFVSFEWEAGGLAFGAVPAWAAAIILPAGFGVMALRFASACIRGLMGIAGEDVP